MLLIPLLNEPGIEEDENADDESTNTCLAEPLAKTKVAGGRIVEKPVGGSDESQDKSGYAAREDTVLFPALHRLLSAKEYDQMGDLFEAKERDLFGEEGFEKAVAEVAEIEQALGIADLAQFTPPNP